MSKCDRGCANQCHISSKDSNCSNSLASCFFSLPPKQFALLGTLIGILLIDNLDVDQQNALGNFIASIGQAIMTAAAQVPSDKNNNSENDQIRKQIQSIKQQICALEKEVDHKMDS